MGEGGGGNLVVNLLGVWFCQSYARVNLAIWGGAKLSDVLELVGIPKFTAATPLGAKHVEFVSVDVCKEEKGGPYKASIPLRQATNPEADVLLAYEMNGEAYKYLLPMQNRNSCDRLVHEIDTGLGAMLEGEGSLQHSLMQLI